MQQGGFLPDELGFSFYPTSSKAPPKRLEVFRETVAAVHREFQRPVFVAEIGYPAARMTVGAFADWNHTLDGYPLTPSGQADFYRDFTKWAPVAGVSGVRPWAPETVVPGWDPFALFQLDGKTAVARPALKALREGFLSQKR
jgi:arabinogalactan endo-1,4-beta-galactosidase